MNIIIKIPKPILNITNLINNLGIYIHYPFCIKKCFYCDFYKTTTPQRYFEKKIIEEIKETKENLTNIGYKFFPVGTIYFGGGTPSLMPIHTLEKIINYINLEFKTYKDIEITIEANPESINHTYLKNLKSIGINRISIGIQSFNIFGLRIMGRIHNPTDILQNIKIIQKYFDKYNLDFILLYPYQTIQSLKNDLKTIISISSPHLSFYMMDIDKKNLYPTTLLNKIKKLHEQADKYYNIIIDQLSKTYEHYEISNFAINKLYCKHNIKYWYYADYIGLGPSAVSKITINQYVYRIQNLPNNKKYTEKIDTNKQIEEKIMLSLRTKWGIIINNQQIKLNSFSNYNRQVLEILEKSYQNSEKFYF